MLQQMLEGLIAQTEPAASGGSPFFSIVPFIAIFAVMYFLIIRPQQKQQKKQGEFISQLKKGDDVVLSSGFFAKVVLVGEADVTVEIAPNVKVRVLKSTVSGSSPLAQAAAKPAEAKSEAEKKS